MRLPHIVLNDMLTLLFELYGILVRSSDTGVCQMLKFVARIIRIVVLWSKSQVRSLPKIQSQWADTCNEYPLANVKLLAEDNKVSFYVLLDHPDGDIWNAHSLYHLVYVWVDLDTSPARLGPRLDNPKVSIVGQAELLFSNQVTKLLKSGFGKSFDSCRFDICKSTLERPVVSRSCQINANIWFAQIVVHFITHCVELTWAKLWVVLDIYQELTAQNVNAPLNYRNCDCNFLKISFCVRYWTLLHCFKKWDNKSELKVLPEVLKFCTFRVTHIKRLWKDSSDIHVMLPD